jgi:t-SNARE complex subunit (syntaxin)
VEDDNASATRGSTTSKKSSNAFGKKNSKHKNENSIQELAGHLFTFGNQGQQSNYPKTKRAIADFFGMSSDFGKEIFKAIKEGKEPEFKEPEEPPSKASQAQLRKYEILFKRYLDNEEKYKREKTRVFRVIMWQCTPTLRNKLESLPEYYTT